MDCVLGAKLDITNAGLKKPSIVLAQTEFTFKQGVDNRYSNYILIKCYEGNKQNDDNRKLFRLVQFFPQLFPFSLLSQDNFFIRELQPFSVLLRSSVGRCLIQGIKSWEPLMVDWPTGKICLMFILINIKLSHRWCQAR